MKVQEYSKRARKFDSASPHTLKQRRYILEHVAEWLDENVEDFDPAEDELTVDLAKRYIENHLEDRLFLDEDEHTEFVRDENGRFVKAKNRGKLSTDMFRIYFDAIQDYLKKMLDSQQKQEQEFDQFSDGDVGYRAEKIPDSEYERKVRTDENYIKTFGKGELQRIIDSVFAVRSGLSSYRAWLILRLIRDSGRRPREVCMIAVDDIDFENERIHYHILKKKDPTKEWVAVDSELLVDLKDYLDRINVSEGYVFFAGDNDEHLSPDTVDTIFKEAAGAAGVELNGRSLKNIRHTVVTTLREEHGLTYDDISDGFTHNTPAIMRQSYSQKRGEVDIPTGEQLLKPGTEAPDDSEPDRGDKPQQDESGDEKIQAVVDRYDLA